MVRVSPLQRYYHFKSKYALGNTSKIHEANLTEDNSTITAVDFNALLFKMDRTSRQQVNKETEDLRNTIN
jgi:hypothetical protein